jgi:segregation and condensation protein A
LQDYERFKKAAEDIDQLPRMERDAMPTSIEIVERKVVRMPPQVTLQEMLLAFKDVLSRAEMFAHHHIHREPLSIRQRMSDILSTLRESAFLDFVRLFKAEEGRMGVTVTFIAILQLMKDGLIEIVQAEPYAPIHVRPHSGSRHLTVVSDNVELTDADAENEAALAQPAYPDENDEAEEPEIELSEELTDAEAAAIGLGAASGDDAAEADADAESDPRDFAAAAADVSADEVAVMSDDALASEAAASDATAAAEADFDEESSSDDRVTRATEGDENTGQGQ